MPEIRIAISSTFAATITSARRWKTTGDRYSLLAIQGPKAAGLLQRFTKVPLEPIRYYHFAFGDVDGVHCMIARTGYTGEDGFEIYFAPEHSEKIWNRFLDAGSAGGRNSLRPGRAQYAAHWKPACASTAMKSTRRRRPGKPASAWICKPEKGEFLGREILVQQKQRGLERKLVGFEMHDKRIGRDGYPVAIGGRELGRVTSGGPAPFLKKNIGMAYLPVAQSAIGTAIEIIVRGQPAAAQNRRNAFLQKTQVKRCSLRKSNLPRSTHVSSGLPLLERS